MDDTRSLDGLTRWFESRLDEMVPPRRSLVRRYGLEVIDADAIDRLDPLAVRAVFLCEAGDAATMCALHGHEHGFDATATVEWAWVSADPQEPARPGRFTGRRRMRFVTVELRQ